eukprot:210175-Pyramimonas_sp.AAC.1
MKLPNIVPAAAGSPTFSRTNCPTPTSVMSTSPRATKTPPDDEDGPPDLLRLQRVPADLPARWKRLRTYLATQPPARMWATVKALAGAWATSYRMHVIQDKRPCHFGCTHQLAEDNIQHCM